LRILLIVRHFPPEVSGGARRPFALATMLRELGHSVDLAGPIGLDDHQAITVKHPTFPSRPDVAQPAKSVQIDPPLAKLARWARIWLLLPDPEIRFAVRLMRAIKRSAKGGATWDWIITTSPPESLHLMGALLKRALGCNWLVEARDNWIEPPQRAVLKASQMRRWIETFIARKSLRSADALVAVDSTVMNEYAPFCSPAVRKEIIGHFALPFDGEIEILPSQTFNIVHTGSFSLSNPLSQFTPLLESFESAAARVPVLRLWLAGNLSEDETASIARSAHRDKIICLGAVSAHRARALQLGADALALVSGTESTAVPGKVSEYALAGRPILLAAIGPWVDRLDPSLPLISWMDIGDHVVKDLNMSSPNRDKTALYSDFRKAKDAYSQILTQANLPAATSEYDRFSLRAGSQRSRPNGPIN